MKPLSETYKELGIDFTFPIEIKDANGRATYYEDSNGFWYKYERDSNGNETYFEDSNGFWRKCEYDANGNETYFEDSNGEKQGTPKAAIILDREETILFADILKAASTPPTPEFKRALRAYRDFIIGHKQ